MTNERRLWVLALIYLGIISALVLVRPQEIDWSRNYDVELEHPFASKLVYEYLKETHPGGVKILENSWVDHEDTLPQKGNLVIIGEGAQPDDLEEERLLEWVHAGGTLFWADREFPGSFMDTFHFYHDKYLPSVIGDSTDLFERYERLNWTTIPGADSVRFFVGYNFDVCVPNSDFSGTVLSRAENNKPVMLELRVGKGKLLLHSVPLVFTNFHFAERLNAGYALQAFSYLSDGPVLWDQYRTGVEDSLVNRSPLRVIGKYPALKTAWYFSLLFGLMYLFWMGKRRQSVVPVLEPKVNKSLEFAEQLGDLYYKQSDARSILMKRIRGLQVASMEQFNILLEEFSEAEKEQLAGKMGIPTKDLDPLWEAVHFIRRNRLIEESELLYYNKLFNRVMNQAY